LAIILIGVGSAAIEVLAAYQSLLRVTIPAGIIVLGLFLLILTVFGFVGVFKKSSKIFTWYLLLLLFLIIIQFGIGGGAYSYRNSIPTRIQTAWNDLSNNDKNKIQIQFSCCGYSNYTDSPGSNCWANATTNGTTSTGSGTTGLPMTTGLNATSGTTATTSAGFNGTTATSGSGVPTGRPTTTGSVTTGGITTTEAPPGKRDEEDYEEDILVRGMFELYANRTSVPGCGQEMMTTLQHQLTVVATVGIVFAVLQLAAFLCGGVLFLWLRLTKQFSQLDEEY